MPLPFFALRFETQGQLELLGAHISEMDRARATHTPTMHGAAVQLVANGRSRLQKLSTKIRRSFASLLSKQARSDELPEAKAKSHESSSLSSHGTMINPPSSNLGLSNIALIGSDRHGRGIMPLWPSFEVFHPHEPQLHSNEHGSNVPESPSSSFERIHNIVICNSSDGTYAASHGQITSSDIDLRSRQYERQTYPSTLPPQQAEPDQTKQQEVRAKIQAEEVGYKIHGGAGSIGLQQDITSKFPSSRLYHTNTSSRLLKSARSQTQTLDVIETSCHEYAALNVDAVVATTGPPPSDLSGIWRVLFNNNPKEILGDYVLQSKIKPFVYDMKLADTVQQDAVEAEIVAESELGVDKNYAIDAASVCEEPAVQDGVEAQQEQKVGKPVALEKRDPLDLDDEEVARRMNLRERMQKLSMAGSQCSPQTYKMLRGRP